MSIYLEYTNAVGDPWGWVSRTNIKEYTIIDNLNSLFQIDDFDDNYVYKLNIDIYWHHKTELKTWIF
jgi:hypothetical protein